MDTREKQDRGPSIEVRTARCLAGPVPIRALDECVRSNPWELDENLVHHSPSTWEQNVRLLGQALHCVYLGEAMATPSDRETENRDVSSDVLPNPEPQGAMKACLLR